MTEAAAGDEFIEKREDGGDWPDCGNAVGLITFFEKDFRAGASEVFPTATPDDSFSHDATPIGSNRLQPSRRVCHDRRMASLTVENYLKTLHQIALSTGTDWVSTGQLAEAMRVSPGTVTSMLKTLASTGLATYKPYEGARLTPSGRKLALRMIRRHRLLELFLVQTLKLTWDQVHPEAENLEHAVSDDLIDRIDAFLGHPVHDPHGDPIPAADGAMRGVGESGIPLSSCQPGIRIRFVRVLNQGSEFLRYLSDTGLTIGMEGDVVENNREAEIVTSRFGGKSISMGHTAAEKLLVQELPPD